MPAAPVVVDAALADIAPGLAGERPVISQNGLVFRSTCAHCNSEVGRRYDPALQEFGDQVRRLVASSLHLLELTNVRVRPTAVVRAVMFHILASGMDSGRDTAFDEPTRRILFHDDMSIPPEINLSFWVYRGDEPAAVRDVCVAWTPAYWSVQFEVMCLLKVPPLGFVALRTSKPYEDLITVTRPAWRALSLDEEVDVPVRIRDRKPAHWPLLTGPGRLVFVGREGMEGVVARRRSK